MEKLTKEQIVGELLAEGQITAEEAVTLLTEKASTIINNYTTPENIIIQQQQHKN